MGRIIATFPCKKRFTKTYAVDLQHVHECGLYALYRNGVIVYIGQSNHILRRIGEHRAEGEKYFDSFSCIRCDDKKERDEWERRLIQQHHPEYNIQMNYNRKQNRL